jgi:(p)ppGpp synthase/HD superfamily hydrolase
MSTNLNNLLAKAIRIAATAHEAQVDKVGQPYILHPLRMMQKAHTIEEKIVAILHDVLEDTPWTIAQLESEGFPPVIVEALHHVTRRPEDSEGDKGYAQFVERIATAPGESGKIARIVKQLDLQDNMDLLRLPTLLPTDIARLERYHRAYHRLQEAGD